MVAHHHSRLPSEIIFIIRCLFFLPWYFVLALDYLHFLLTIEFIVSKYNWGRLCSKCSVGEMGLELWSVGLKSSTLLLIITAWSYYVLLTLYQREKVCSNMEISNYPSYFINRAWINRVQPILYCTLEKHKQSSTFFSEYVESNLK